jgi:ribosome-associated heat shock protein Hsp15
VAGFADRRGDSQAAQLLYEDLTTQPDTAPAAAAPATAEREPGAGRPTKQDRRALDRLRRRDEE